MSWTPRPRSKPQFQPIQAFPVTGEGFFYANRRGFALRGVGGQGSVPFLCCPSPVLHNLGLNKLNPVVSPPGGRRVSANAVRQFGFYFRFAFGFGFGFEFGFVFGFAFGYGFGFVFGFGFRPQLAASRRRGRRGVFLPHISHSLVLVPVGEIEIGLALHLIEVDTALSCQTVQGFCDLLLGDLLPQGEQVVSEEDRACISPAFVVHEGDQPHPHAELEVAQRGNALASGDGFFDDSIGHETAS